MVTVSLDASTEERKCPELTRSAECSERTTYLILCTVHIDCASDATDHDGHDDGGNEEQSSRPACDGRRRRYEYFSGLAARFGGNWK